MNHSLNSLGPAGNTETFTMCKLISEVLTLQLLAQLFYLHLWPTAAPTVRTYSAEEAWGWIVKATMQNAADCINNIIYHISYQYHCCH